METEMQCKQIVAYVCDGRRDIGRPRIRWLDLEYQYRRYRVTREQKDVFYTVYDFVTFTLDDKLLYSLQLGWQNKAMSHLIYCYLPWTEHSDTEIPFVVTDTLIKQVITWRKGISTAHIQHRDTSTAVFSSTENISFLSFAAATCDVTALSG